MKPYKQSFLAWEYKYIISVIEAAEISKAKASKIANLSRMQIDRILARHGITIFVERGMH